MGDTTRVYPSTQAMQVKKRGKGTIAIETDLMKELNDV